MTYNLIKRLITNAKNRGACDQKFVDDMKNKMDVFLLNNRVTEEEYNELTKLMEA